MTPSFVHLRLHSEFSLIDGLIQIKPLMKALPDRGMAAVAVTDYCNLYAAVKVYKAALDAGIKPIIGADLPLCDASKPQQPGSMLMLCQNEQGYKNLTCLISKAYQEGQYHGLPRVHREWLPEFSEGLIVLSGGRAGDVGQALLSGDRENAERLARHWAQIYPDRYYLEVQRTGRPDENLYNERVIELAQALDLPLVATHEVCFLDADDFDAHEARVCIHDSDTLVDPNRPKRYSPNQFLQSAEAMQALFADLPSAVANTVEIARRCSVQLELGKNYLPDFPVPAGMTIESYLSDLSRKGLAERFPLIFAGLDEAERAQKQPEYEQRLQIELDVINNMGFAGYFLIVADFIQWAKNNGVPVGPGRGSGAGSLVAYALKITDLDPLQFELLFERFLNPERVSMPDFDVDFCMEGRDRVIEYVAEKYGRQSVSQIITFGTMAAKAVVRDVGRVLGQPYPMVDSLAKLIPFEIGITLSKAMEQEEELRRRYEQEEEVKDLIDLALKLEGITRNVGKHAGGVVIAPSQLTDFTAIYCEQDSNQIVSQFDKDDVEAVGLVKFDFLGLRTLTIIDWALATVNQQRALTGLPPIDISTIPIDDSASYDLLKACKTTAVFQLESRGMKDLINRLQPDCFEEIIALVALFRPGPLQSGMVDDFIDRKHGRSPVEYPHPDLEPILKPTYGVILYQEQVMQIAQVLASYTLGGADLLRRAMGKKKPEEMAKQREIFTEGAAGRGVDRDLANSIFDLMEKFAGYGFNKSHSAAYALVSYQTLWLKTHYPAAFMAAVMSSDMDNTDKVVTFVDEAANMGLKVLPPDVNSSFYKFTVDAQDQIVYGLGAIKGVGEAAIQSIVEAREAEGPFTDLFSFCRRIDLRKVNRRALEPLVKSGALDSLGVERAVLMASLDKAIKLAEKQHANQRSGQIDLFSLLEDEDSRPDYLPADPWAERQRLDFERETLGYYLSGHPADVYRRELADYIIPIHQLQLGIHKKVTLVGQIVSLRKLLTKRGKKLVIMGLDDGTGKLDIVVFGEIAEGSQELLSSGQILVVEGEISLDEFNGGIRMTANQLSSLAMARSRFARCLQIRLTAEEQALLPSLQALLKANRGRCLLQWVYQNDKARAHLNCPTEWAVNPDDGFLQQLRQLLGAERVQLCY